MAQSPWYTTEEELVYFAVRARQVLELRHAALREHVQEGIDELDRGEGIEIENEGALRSFFDEIQSRGQQRYRASGRTG